MPAHPMLHAFGALLIYRQQETGFQCKPGSRGHHARSLGQPEAQKHLRLGHGPQERTSADRQQRPETGLITITLVWTSRTAPSSTPAS